MNSSLRNGEIQQGDGWFRHDGIGYRGENLKLTAGPRTGDWRYVEGGLTRPVPETKELFTLTVEHGVKPRNASYIYTILPASRRRVRRAKRQNRFEVIPEYEVHARSIHS